MCDVQGFEVITENGKDNWDGTIYEKKMNELQWGGDISDKKKKNSLYREKERGKFYTLWLYHVFALLLHYSDAFHDISPMCK